MPRHQPPCLTPCCTDAYLPCPTPISICVSSSEEEEPCGAEFLKTQNRRRGHVRVLALLLHFSCPLCHCRLTTKTDNRSRLTGGLSSFSRVKVGRQLNPGGTLAGPAACRRCCVTRNSAERFLSFQIEAKGTLDGEKVEHQRTTFVKQLKLGKVSPRHTPCRPSSQGPAGSRPPTACCLGFSRPQLPQCLCIHLQRLSWSSHGTPLKRHEHVQFNEFLMMDIYKYHLLGHRPGQHSPKPGESAGPSLDLQDGPAAPRSGACPRSQRTERAAQRKGIWCHRLLGPLCCEGACPVMA